MHKLIVMGIVLLLAGQQAVAQDYEARINRLLNEVAMSELQHKIAQCANTVSLALVDLRAPTVAILPFCDPAGRGTGLTEYLAVALGNKLLQRQIFEVLPAVEAHALLPERWRRAPRVSTSMYDSLAAHLRVPILLHARVLAEAEEFLWLVELYDGVQHRKIDLPQTLLPRAPAFNRLHEIICDENAALPCGNVEALLAAVPAPDANLNGARLEARNALAATSLLLAQKLNAPRPKDRALKIAVMDFADLKGRTTQLGRLFAEELTASLLQFEHFMLVERRMLHEILREQALAQTGVLELAQAQAVGRAAGAEALVLGTLSELNDEIKVNARLIEVRSGKVLVAVGESLQRTRDFTRLLHATIEDSSAEK